MSFVLYRPGSMSTRAAATKETPKPRKHIKEGKGKNAVSADASADALLKALVASRFLF